MISQVIENSQCIGVVILAADSNYKLLARNPLGAPSRGVMGIFLSYGLLLGLVGSGAGLVIGLLFVNYINEIADLLGTITGRPVFNPSIYYFYEIPTIVDPVTIAWIVSGAVAIAVLASILPAIRAAMLHPVEALRYE